MRKNVVSQLVDCQLIDASTGAAVTTGTTTVYVTGDGGSQTAGAGTVTHKGNGLWQYAPTQAETNYNHVAFSFINSLAVPAVVQIYTSFPQTGDTFVRLGPPAGASIAADIASNPDSSGVTTLLSRLSSGRATNLDFLDVSVASRLSTAGYTTPPTASAISVAVVDQTLTGHTTSGTVGAALNTAASGGGGGGGGDPWATTLPGAYAAGTAGYILGTQLAPNNIADAVLKRDWTSVTGEASHSVLNAMRFIRDGWSVAGTVLTVLKHDGSTAWTGTATLDTSGAITGMVGG